MCNQVRTVENQPETESPELCPLCQARMVKCSGDAQMPASKNFMQCPNCRVDDALMLSAHVSSLANQQQAQEIARRHKRALQEAVIRGQNAQRILAKITATAQL